MRRMGLGRVLTRRFSDGDRGRLMMGAVLVLALGLIALAGLTRLAGALEPDPAQQLLEAGPEGLLGLEEERLVALLGQPQERETLGAEVRLTYGGEMPFSLTLPGDGGVCTAVTVQGMTLLGVEPGVPTAQARSALSQGGIRWLDNAFDPAYGGGGVRSPDMGWLAAYSGGYLYEFCYDREDAQQTIRSVRVGEGAPLEQPTNLFCAPQLYECLEGTDPIALLGMTPEKARVRWGFCGETLSLTVSYTDGQAGGLLSTSPDARYGYGAAEVCYGCTGDYGTGDGGRYLMLVTQSPQLPVLGLVPGTTTQREAAGVLLNHGGVECTLAAPALLEEGADYGALDPALRQPQDAQAEVQIYLTSQWYVELRFDGEILSRAVFCLLDHPVDLTPPAREVGGEDPVQDGGGDPDTAEPLPEAPQAQPEGGETPGGGYDTQSEGETSDQEGQGTAYPGGQGGTTLPQGQTGTGQTQGGWRAFTVGGVTFSLLLPDGWDQKCTMVQSTDSLILYEAGSYQTQWGGALLTIRCYAPGEDYGQTAYRVLAETGAGTLVATYPSQVQYNTSDGAAAQRYQQLSDSLAGILSTMKLIG